uniref:hypothetical protein n=1 Tax=Agathobacter sp. TaxID=2021311 RepID=UPI00405626EF
MELGKSHKLLKEAKSEPEKEYAIAQIRKLEKERVFIPYSDPMDKEYARWIWIYKYPNSNF